MATIIAILIACVLAISLIVIILLSTVLSEDRKKEKVKHQISSTMREFGLRKDDWIIIDTETSGLGIVTGKQ